MAWPFFVLLVLPYLGLASSRVREHFARTAPVWGRPAFDVLLVLALWLPVELRLVPRLPLVLAPGLEVPATKLIGLDLALIVFLLLRPLPGIGYTFRLTRGDLGRALAAAAVFLVVAIPLADGLGFAHYAGVTFDPWRGLLGALAIFFFIAIPEELLFRGLGQNLIERAGGRSWLTLVAASVAFGAAHLNNATAHHGVPNWTYMLMASLAGVAYGWVWGSTGKITAAAVTHAIVDGVWVAAFRA